VDPDLDQQWFVLPDPDPGIKIAYSVLTWPRFTMYPKKYAESSVSVLYSMRSVDPDPDSESGSRKAPNKDNMKKFNVFKRFVVLSRE
jgi:hypothetical protein